MPAEEETPARGSVARGIAFGGLAAVVGAVTITVSGGILAMTAGLLVIAAGLGWAVAIVLQLDPVAVTNRRRRWLAVVLASVGVALGQVGLWLLARQEGGVLGLPEYLAEVFGILVPLQLVVAAAVAWWRAR
jgi:hypothetical protein